MMRRSYELRCPAARMTMCIYRDAPILPSDAVAAFAWSMWEESPSDARDRWMSGLEVEVLSLNSVLLFSIRNNPAWLSGGRGFDRPFVVEMVPPARIESEEL
jgi:hypothetical protein